MKQAVIVVLDFAQFQEIQTGWNKKTELIKERRIRPCLLSFLLSNLIQSFHLTRTKFLSLLLRSSIIFTSVPQSQKVFSILNKSRTWYHESLKLRLNLKYLKLNYLDFAWDALFYILKNIYQFYQIIKVKKKSTS